MTAPPDVQRLALQPGDRIILRYPYHLPGADRDAIAADARRTLCLPSDVPLLVLGDNATVAVVGESMKLLPAENMALTAARAQVQRGDEVPPNTTAMLVMIIDRLTGHHDCTAEGPSG